MPFHSGMGSMYFSLDYPSDDHDLWNLKLSYLNQFKWIMTIKILCIKQKHVVQNPKHKLPFLV
jgi:hypothetical protein